MASKLPDYVASAKPLPMTARVPWYKSTAQTYAGIMLWFVFWQQVPFGSSSAPGGFLAHGLGTAILALVAAALICHFLFYLVPGLMGMKTGLPLYIVGTSTYGVQGGFLMPGFLMGVLQFGWLAVNAYFSGWLLVSPFFESMAAAKDTPVHMVVAALWAILGAFMGLKGIKYVARVATFLPLIPFVILIVLCVATIGGLGKFDANALVTSGQAAGAGSPLSTFALFALMISYVVGFFATAGAAGVDIAMNNRTGKDVQLGGIFGVALSTIFAGGLALLIVAGAYGMIQADPTAMAGLKGLNPAEMMERIMGTNIGRVFMYLLVIAAFPAACFSAFIAANSFKTTLPKVNPLISCGIGTAVAIALVISGWAGKAAENVFPVIGASFGPVCGAMMADYLLAGRKWPGPRAGFNMAGWISWIVGLAVGAVDFIAKIPKLESLAGKVPCPPVAAFVVGFVLYIILAAIGLQGKTLEMPAQAKG
jgi:cytosine permease